MCVVTVTARCLLHNPDGCLLSMFCFANKGQVVLMSRSILHLGGGGVHVCIALGGMLPGACAYYRCIHAGIAT